MSDGEDVYMASRRRYRQLKDTLWGVVYGAANREREKPYEFPTFEQFQREEVRQTIFPQGTTTGRMSCQDVDLQQLPFPERKKLIIPPPGSVIYWDESGELMLKMPEKED